MKALLGMGVELVSGVPCSLLGALFEKAQQGRRYVAASNEGDAVAIACGAQLGGQPAVVLMQNSGLGNAVNPLTSLVQTFQIPILLIISLRGDPEGPLDAPQHRLMGKITTSLLELMEIPWGYLPDTSEGLEEVTNRILLERGRGRSFALIVRRGDLSVRPSERVATTPPPRVAGKPGQPLGDPLERMDVLKDFVAQLRPDDIVVASTGYLGRQLHHCQDREGFFYMVGSMGCAASLGLGLALARPERRVIVLDGDAALAMRLGALTTIGAEAPANLFHLVLDNGLNESTGGQASPSAGVDFSALARACGYRWAGPVGGFQALSQPGPTLLHIPVKPTPGKPPPRPDKSPVKLARRLERFLQQ